MGRDSSVGIAILYGLDGPGIESCGEKDTLQHRITSCEEGSVIWNWARVRIAAILQVHPTHIPEEWNVRPTYKFWPTQKQAAITWIIAHLVKYRLQTQRRLSLQDFLRRARWKEYQHTPRSHMIGRYLDVL
jgi:hypothetical protein